MSAVRDAGTAAVRRLRSRPGVTSAWAVVAVGVAGAVARRRRGVPADVAGDVGEVLVDLPGWRRGPELAPAKPDDLVWGGVADAVALAGADRHRCRYRQVGGGVVEVHAATTVGGASVPPGLVVDLRPGAGRRLRLAPVPRSAFLVRADTGDDPAARDGHAWHDGHLAVVTREHPDGAGAAASGDRDPDDDPSSVLLERLTRLAAERESTGTPAHPRLGLSAVALGLAATVGAVVRPLPASPALAGGAAAGAVAGAGLWEAGAVVVHRRDGRRTRHALAPRTAVVAVAGGAGLAAGLVGLAGAVARLRRRP